MATVFIIAHAPLASALAAAAEHLGLAHGPLLALDVLPEWGAAETLAQAQAALALAPAEGGVESELLLLTDAFGATPCSTARLLASGRQARVVCGVNVPMLWGLLGRHQQRPLDELVQRALGTGKDGVMHVPALLAPAQGRALKDGDAEAHGHHQ
jgi:mannose PTS system EIIA component